MRKEKLLENIRIYSHSKALFGAIFLIFVVGVFMYVILGSNMFLVSVDGNDRAIITVRRDRQGVIDICGVELAEERGRLKRQFRGELIERQLPVAVEIAR